MSTIDSPHVRQIRTSVCPLDCPDSCSLLVTVEEGRVVALDGSEANPITQGFICGKVKHFPEILAGPGRILHPAIRAGAKGEGRFRQATWDEALSRIIKEVDRARAQFGGESILPLCYGGSNGYLTQNAVDARWFRRIGASRLALTVCAAPATRAATGMYGKFPGVAFPDYVHARLIVLWGVNPSATSVHLVPYIREAQRAGARLVVVDPRATPLARSADLHLPIRPGTDVALALSVANRLFEDGGADLEFLARHADQVDEFRARAATWTVDRAAEVTGLAAGDISKFADWYRETDPAVIRCGWGTERNRNGGSAIAAVLALPAIAGKFGQTGGGYTLSNSSAWDLDTRCAANEPEVNTRLVNMNQAGEALLSLSSPPVRVLFVYNGNPLATLPEQEKMRRGLSREDLFTVVFDSVRTDTAQFADVLLPATTFLEHREMRRGYGALVLQEALPAVEPPGEARPNYEVFAELTARMGLARPDDPCTPEALSAAIVATARDAERLSAELAAMGRALPACGERSVQFRDHFPTTPNGRIQLVSPALDAESPEGLYAFQADPGTGEFPLALISPASPQAITSTLFQLVDGQVPISIHPDDAAVRGLTTGEKVRVWNRSGEVICDARIDDTMRPGVVCLPKGLWARHTHNGRSANALAPDRLTDLGGGACFNDARVQIARYRAM